MSYKYKCHCMKSKLYYLNYPWSTDGDIILIAPPFPVHEGDRMVLSCQYKTGNHSKTVLYKNRVKIFSSNSSSSGKVINLTIDSVTPSDEGFYKCASQDGKTESPESWLSVTPDRGQLFALLHFMGIFSLTGLADGSGWCLLLYISCIFRSTVGSSSKSYSFYCLCIHLPD